jgi:hypothetical protein
MVEPTDAVLTILQQIQETLAEHSQQFSHIDSRFDKIDRRLDEAQLTRRVEELERAR